MDNILKQFSNTIIPKGYVLGTILEKKLNDIYLVVLSNGMQLTIQDTQTEYTEEDVVWLAIPKDSANNAFILKKANKNKPTSSNFIVGMGIN